MAKYLAVHPVGKDFTAESGTPFAKAAKANHTVDAYWIRSWYVQEEGKLYCEYDAKDAESIRQVLSKAAKVTGELPTEGIYKIDLMVNSEDFR
jgi:hypothetical protein